MAWSLVREFSSGWQNDMATFVRAYTQNQNVAARTIDVLAETYLSTTNGRSIGANFSGSAQSNDWGGARTDNLSVGANSLTYFTGFWKTHSYNANGELDILCGGWLRTNNVIAFDQTAQLWQSMPSIPPLALTALTVTRVSDSQHTVSWSIPAGVTNHEVIVQRRTDEGAWTQVGRPAGNVASWSDTTTVAGRRYDYRVAGVRGGRQAAWSGIATVYTTPAPPSAVSAVKVGTNIEVTATGLPAWATSYDVWDNGVAVASGVTSWPWTHVDPDSGQTHTYTVVSRRGALASAPSAPSNTVQLLAAPLAPSGLTPNGIAVPQGSVRLGWQHNPIDTTGQTTAEVRYRYVGDSVWWGTAIVTGSAEHVDVAGLVPDLVPVEWQTRTKGTHPDWSPWSPVATVTVLSRPGVAVTQPGAGWDQPILPVTWSYLQGQGRPQSGWRVELLDAASQRLEYREGTGPAGTVVLAARLEHGVAYTVRVQAAAGEVWSEWAAQNFSVAFVAPAPAEVSAVWNDRAGSAEVAVGEGRGPAIPDVVNYAPSLSGPTAPVELRRNRFTRPQLSASLTGWQRRGEDSWVDSPAQGYSEVEVLAASNSGTNLLVMGSSGYRSALVEGESCTSGMLVENIGPVDFTVRLYLDMRTTVSGGTSTGVVSGDPFTLAPGERKLLTATAVGVAGTVAYASTLRPIGSDSVPVGAKMRVYDGSFSELTQTRVPMHPLFGGMDYSEYDPDLTATYVGAANASETILTGRHLTALADTNCRSVIAATGELRVIPTTTAIDSFVSFTMPAPTRGGGVFMATRRQNGPVSTGMPSARARNLTVHSATVQQQAPYPRPNVAGYDQIRFEYVAIPTYWNARLYHGGSVGSGDVYWSDIGLMDGDYRGPWFDGDSGRIVVGESSMATGWDGIPHQSYARASMVPETDVVKVERSVDGGLSWELVLVGPSDLAFTDWESLSRGVTRYRVTATAASGAASTVVHELVAESGAIWLSTGAGFEKAARLPYDPVVKISAGRARSVQRYEGRSHGVPYAGEQLTRVVEVSGRLRSGDPDVVSVDALEMVAQDAAPLHMYRDPDGRRVYGALSSVTMPRQSSIGLWGYGFTLEESDR